MREILIVLFVTALCISGCGEVKTEVAMDQEQPRVANSVTVSQTSEPSISNSITKGVKPRTKAKRRLIHVVKHIPRRKEKRELNDLVARVMQSNGTAHYQESCRHIPAASMNTDKKTGGDIMMWLYGALAGLALLIIGLSYRIGYAKSLKDTLYQQQRLEATKIWAETMKNFTGGHNGKRT